MIVKICNHLSLHKAFCFNCVNRHWKNHHRTTNTRTISLNDWQKKKKIKIMFHACFPNREGHGRAAVESQWNGGRTRAVAVACWSTAALPTTRQLFFVDLFTSQPASQNNAKRCRKFRAKWVMISNWIPSMKFEDLKWSECFYNAKNLSPYRERFLSYQIK